MKQAILVRTDLNMSKGKIAAQASHASLKAYRAASESDIHEWEESGQKKIVLKVSSEKELIDIFMLAKRQKLPAALIRDAGHTEVEAGTATCAGIGPAEDDKIDRLCGMLKLL